MSVLWPTVARRAMLGGPSGRGTCPSRWPARAGWQVVDFHQLGGNTMPPTKLAKWWMAVAVDGELEWPLQETTVKFEGGPLLLRPAKGNAYADIRVQYDHPSGDRAALELVCRFLS